jgi:hypothetical protein
MDTHHKSLFARSSYQTVKLKMVTSGGETEQTSHITQMQGRLVTISQYHMTSIVNVITISKYLVRVYFVIAVIETDGFPIIPKIFDTILRSED